MNKEQFLDVMDEIGDDLVENFLDIPNERFYIPKRTPFWKIAVSTAAAVCVLTTGIFAAAKLRIIQSSAVSSNSEQQTGTEIIKSDNSVSLTESVAINEPVIMESTGNFSFSLEGRDDLYYGISGKANKSDWKNPAVVTVTYGDLSLTNRAYLSVTGDPSWPEQYILSEEVMLDSITSCEIKYNADYVVTLPVYLLATTDDDVTFWGYWEP